MNRCTYCSAPCRHLVCRGHSDLPALDYKLNDRVESPPMPMRATCSVYAWCREPVSRPGQPCWRHSMPLKGTGA